MNATSILTVLFTDIVGSTEDFDRLGEDAAFASHSGHMAEMGLLVDQHDGRVVKSMGDGLMTVFSSAVQALRCAVAMQEAVAAAPDELRIRVGIDCGEPIHKDGDYFGNPVIVAKRLCDLADPEQILMSAVVFAVAGRRVPDLVVTEAGSFVVKGLAEPVECLELRWSGGARATSGTTTPRVSVDQEGTTKAPDLPPLGALLGLVASGAEPEDIMTEFAALGSAPVALLVAREWDALADSVRRPDDSYPASLAWRAGYSLNFLGHTERSIDFFTHADRTELDDAERAQFCAAWAASAWGAGDDEQCRTMATEAADAAEASRDDAALAAAWSARALLASLQGDATEDRRAYSRALEHAIAASDAMMESRVRNNLGSQMYDEAQYGDALEQFGQALRLAELTRHGSAIALIRHNIADVMLRLGRADEALVEVEAARALWASLDSPMVSAAWHVLADIQRARGNTAQAMMAYREAVAVSEREDENQTLVPALVGLALISVATDPEEARQITKRLLDVQIGTGRAPALTTAGWIALHDGDRAAALDFAAQAVDEASRRHARAWLAESLELSVLAGGIGDRESRLREAASIWEAIGDPLRLQINAVIHAHLFGTPFAVSLARAGLRSLGVQDDAYGIAGPLHVLRVDAGTTPVRVHTLGTFVLYRHGEPVAASQWPSRKARDILKILAARGAKGIRRDELADALWPDDDDPGSKLSVALSHLRRVLDPEKAHDPSRFVIADRASVRLDLDNTSVDVVEFRGAAKESLSAHTRGDPGAVEMLEAAAAMHTGEFLSDDLYEDWAVEARDEVEGLGGNVIRVLAFALVRTSDPQRAVSWFARLLHYDPHDEPTYESLIRLLASDRRHGEARRYHRMYEMRMRELDVAARSWEEMTG